MKETKSNRLLRGHQQQQQHSQCCSKPSDKASVETPDSLVYLPGSQSNSHFLYSAHTNHQRLRPLESPVIIKTHSNAPHAHKNSKPNIIDSLNYFQVIALLLIMCLLQSASAHVPQRCLQEFTHLACGAQLERRWTYDSVEMRCVDNIEWPCEEYDGTTNSFGSLDECNRVCINHDHDDDQTPSSPSGEADLETLALITTTEEPLPPVEVCFENPIQSMICENFLPPVRHYFYDSETNECEDYYFLGCDYSNNKFETLESCIATCRDRLHPTTTEAPPSTTDASVTMTTTESVDLPECLLTEPPPPCLDFCPMVCFRFNNESSQCESFRAISCEDSYSSEESCIASCYNTSTTPSTSVDTTQQPSEIPSSHVTAPSDHVTTPSNHVTTSLETTTTETTTDHDETSSQIRLSLLDYASIVLAILAVALVVLLIVVVAVVKYKYRMAVKKHAQEVMEIKKKSISSFTDKHRHLHHQKHSQKCKAMNSSRTITYGDIV